MDVLEKIVRRNRIKAQHIAIITCLSLLAFAAIRINSSLPHISTSKNIRINVVPGTADAIDTSRMKFSGSENEDHFNDAIEGGFETDKVVDNYEEHRRYDSDKNQPNSDLTTGRSIDDEQNELKRSKEEKEQEIGNDIAALPSESRSHIEFVSEVPLSVNVGLDLHSTIANSSSSILLSSVGPKGAEDTTSASTVLEQTSSSAIGELSKSDSAYMNKLVVQKVGVNSTSYEDVIVKNVIQDSQDNFTTGTSEDNEVSMTSSTNSLPSSAILEESDKDYAVTTNQTEVKTLSSEMLNVTKTSITTHTSNYTLARTEEENPKHLNGMRINPIAFTKKIPANVAQFAQDDDEGDDGGDDIGLIGDKQQKLDSNEFSQFII